MTKQEIIKELHGQEILSTKYEGCVGVFQDKVFYLGKVIDTLDTKKKALVLFNELFDYEFGSGINVMSEFL